METEDHTPHANADFFKNLTGETAASGQDAMESIGQRIKAIRSKRGLSLDDISKITGFSVKLLSDIESNAVKPQLGVIIRMSKALDSAFGSIVAEGGSNLYSITRKDEGAFIASSTSRDGKKQAYMYKSLASDMKGRNMETFIVQLEANPGDDMSLHEGEEFIYVLSGVVSLKLGDDLFELEPGDSAYYVSTTPHLVTARNGKASIVAVIYGK